MDEDVSVNARAKMAVALVAIFAAMVVGIAVADNWWRVQVVRATVEMQRNGADPIVASCAAAESRRSIVCAVAAARVQP